MRYSERCAENLPLVDKDWPKMQAVRLGLLQPPQTKLTTKCDYSINVATTIFRVFSFCLFFFYAFDALTFRNGESEEMRACDQSPVVLSPSHIEVTSMNERYYDNTEYLHTSHDPEQTCMTARCSARLIPTRMSLPSIGARGSPENLGLIFHFHLRISVSVKS